MSISDNRYCELNTPDYGVKHIDMYLLFNSTRIECEDIWMALIAGEFVIDIRDITKKT